MNATTHPMSVEEFRKLPESGPVYYELRHGEPVALTRPKLKHHLIQDCLVEVLKPEAKAVGYVSMEFAFRPLPEHELRVADVAFVRWERLHSTNPEDNLNGAPDLVIEILSPSNTAAEMYEKESICLENGAEEFWVVDPDRRHVRVAAARENTVTWREGQEIPLRLFGSAAGLKVSGIFR